MCVCEYHCKLQQFTINQNKKKTRKTNKIIQTSPSPQKIKITLTPARHRIPENKSIIPAVVAIAAAAAGSP